MKTRNLTLALDLKLLDDAKAVARKNNLSLSGFIRKLLSSAIYKEPATDWIDDFLKVCDEVEGDSKGLKWTREDLYER